MGSKPCVSIKRKKKQFIKIAQELHCSPESIRRLNDAENMIQLENIMISAWQTIPDYKDKPED